MYFGDAPLFGGGHESAGVTAPSATWFLAEGATGSFFETFVLLANPNSTAATATVTYLPDTGAPVTAVKTIPAHGRVTVNVEHESPSLANAAVSIAVAATQPILVERSQYRPDPAPSWQEAHNSFGVVATGTRWALAEGRVGGPPTLQTYVLARESRHGRRERHHHVPARQRRGRRREDVRRAAREPLQRAGRTRDQRART